ncbi:MAG: hypothetical protein ABI725_04500 [Chloroflexota bacterium]
MKKGKGTEWKDVPLVDSAALKLLYDRGGQRIVADSSKGEYRVGTTWRNEPLMPGDQLMAVRASDVEGIQGIAGSRRLGQWSLLRLTPTEAGTAARLIARDESFRNPRPKPIVTKGDIAALARSCRLTPGGGVMVVTPGFMVGHALATIRALEPLIAAHLAGQAVSCDFCGQPATGIAEVNVAVCEEHAKGGV